MGFYLTKGRKNPKVPKAPRVVWWTDMMKMSSAVPKSSMKTDTMAVILFSGGTTGMPKGIKLSNMNFINEGMQVAAWSKMSEDGFFYFKLRLKRMIKSSGFNVYPSRVEDILRKHPAVDQACVIGVPDKAQVERIKAFIELKPEYKDNVGDTLSEELIGHCRKHLIKWNCPRDIEFRDKLPTTKVGKIAFNVLEEEKEKLRNRGEYAG